MLGPLNSGEIMLSMYQFVGARMDIEIYGTIMQGMQIESQGFKMRHLLGH